MLDLQLKERAFIHCFIGRQIATALTRPAYITIRKTDNDTLVIPNTMYDFVSQISVAIVTTLSAGASIGDVTITVTSPTGFVVGDVLCLSGASAARTEFVRILMIVGSVFTLEAPLKIAHNSGDDVRSMSDVGSIEIPGGDKYAITCQNNSGFSVLFRVEAEVESGWTSV
jgi:hypothetical protein